MQGSVSVYLTSAFIVRYLHTKLLKIQYEQEESMWIPMLN